jgi:ribosomal protein L37AE/L43A
MEKEESVRRLDVMPNLFRVITWKESGEQEKCPKCLNIRQDFMEIMPNVWACYQCGCVFVPKAVRYKEIEGKRGQIAKQEAEKELNILPGKIMLSPGNKVVFSEGMEVVSGKLEVSAESGFKCMICEKECASKAGLLAHQRKAHKGGE